MCDSKWGCGTLASIAKVFLSIAELANHGMITIMVKTTMLDRVVVVDTMTPAEGKRRPEQQHCARVYFVVVPFRKFWFNVCEENGIGCRIPFIRLLVCGLN